MYIPSSEVRSITLVVDAGEGREDMKVDVNVNFIMVVRLVLILLAVTDEKEDEDVKKKT